MKRLVALMMCAVSFGAAAQIDWDFPYNPDGNNDGYIFSEDLLDLLVVYGQEFSPESLYLSEDSSRMILKVGDLMHNMECMAACMHLEGSWHVANRNDIVYFYEFLTEGLPIYESQLGISAEDYEGLEAMWVSPIGNMVANELRPFRKNGQNGEDGDQNIVIYHAPLTKELSANSDSEMPVERNKTECWCVTQQRPRAEWHQISTIDWESSKDDLSQNGWRLHSIVDGKVYFWRWAE